MIWRLLFILLVIPLGTVMVALTMVQFVVGLFAWLIKGVDPMDITAGGPADWAGIQIERLWKRTSRHW